MSEAAGRPPIAERDSDAASSEWSWPGAAVDRTLLPFWELLADRFGELALTDVHTHIGQDDPDGFTQSPGELLGGLGPIGARAVTFPMHEPGGYPEANDRAIELARSSEGRVRAFCRVDPTGHVGAAVAEAERCLEAGASGIKLHPRAEGFTLHEPAIGRLFALAAEREVPILIHAGRGIPALGRDALRLAHEHPAASLILAHAGISDLAWLWEEVEAGSNLFFDTAWWNPADLLALFRLVPSSQILWASDSPYGTPLSSAVMHLRLAIQAGLGEEAIRCIAGEQAERLLSGEPTIAIERPDGEREPLDPELGRVYAYLIAGFGASNVGGDPTENLELARLACAVGEHPQAELLAWIDELLGRLLTDHVPSAPAEHRYGDLERWLTVAMTLVRTPAAG